MNYYYHYETESAQEDYYMEPQRNYYMEQEEEDDDYEEIEEPDQSFMLSPRVYPRSRVYDDEEDFTQVELVSSWPYMDEHDRYVEEEVHGIVSVEKTEPRVSSLFVEGGDLQGSVVINDCLVEGSRERNLENQENEETNWLISEEITPPRVSSAIVDGGTSRGEVMINDGLLDVLNDLELEERNAENQEKDDYEYEEELMMEMEMASCRVYEEEEDRYLEEEVNELILEENDDYEYEVELMMEMEMASRRVYEEEEDRYLEEEVNELFPEENDDYKYEEDLLMEMEVMSPSYENGEDIYLEEETYWSSPERIMSPARVYEDESYDLEGDIEGLVQMDALLDNLNRAGNQDNSGGGDDDGGGNDGGGDDDGGGNDGGGEDGGAGEDGDDGDGNDGGGGGGGNNDDVCPICFEAWTSGGDHQICCLPCGHIYGRSCISKWLQTSGKCPHCQRLRTSNDIRVIYASQLRVVDFEESHKRRADTLELRVEALERGLDFFEKMFNKPMAGAKIFEHSLAN